MSVSDRQWDELAEVMTPERWAWVVEHTAELRQAVAWGRVPAELLDEAWSDILCARIPRLLATWDSARGVTLLQWCRCSITWWARKWLASHFKHSVTRPILDDEFAAAIPIDQTLIEAVLSMRHHLGETDYELLMLRHVYEESFTTIGEAYDVSKGTARLWVAAAEERAREMLQSSGLSEKDL